MMKNILLYTWQLPQNLLGLLLRGMYKGTDTQYKDLLVRRSKKMNGGISLGKYVIASETLDREGLLHEWGHSKQSRLLGPLYLLAVGLPSILKASVHDAYNCEGKANWFYFGQYPENWADKIAGIKRDFYNER